MSGAAGASEPFDRLSSRRSYAEKRLKEVSSRVREIVTGDGFQDLCIYVTGSFGRLEASRHSDLDLFFVHKGSANSNAVPRIRKTLLDADLIRAAQRLHFPEFSNDGEYLTVHYLDDIRDALGGPDDDFRNYFTARMLLLLESQPLYNESLYEEILREIVDSYCRDFADHETSFRPLFLTNDIMRFWRTLCLNYEYQRNRPEADPDGHRSDLKNLKLKFSRLLTCHSAVVLLSVNRDSVSPKELLEIVRLTPLDRLDRVAREVPGTTEQVKEIKREYAWFLEESARAKDDMIEWISDSATREDAFGRGREFGTQMYRLLCEVTAGTDTMRFLVV